MLFCLFFRAQSERRKTEFSQTSPTRPSASSKELLCSTRATSEMPPRQGFPLLASSMNAFRTKSVLFSIYFPELWSDKQPLIESKQIVHLMEAFSAFFVEKNKTRSRRERKLRHVEKFSVMERFNKLVESIHVRAAQAQARRISLFVLMKPKIIPSDIKYARVSANKKRIVKNSKA